MSLLICCTGIVLVSLFSAPDQADIKPNTTFTDNLLDVHRDAVEEGKSKGSVLGYIVSISLVSLFCRTRLVHSNLCCFNCS